MTNFEKLLNAIAYKEIKWFLVSDEEETKDRIINVLDKLHENLIYSILSDDEVEKVKVNDLNMLFDYNDCVMFLKKFLPIADWRISTDLLYTTTIWSDIFNELDKIYDELFFFIISKAEKENNLKLNL